MTQSFIEKMAVLYQAVPSPILVSVRLAQACLESSYGQSELARNALNFAGIKASSPWQGETYTKLSNEEIDGKMTQKSSAFRKYASVEDFIKDHSAFYTSTPRRANVVYKQAIEATTYLGQCAALTGTYATDSQYGRNLVEIIERYDLTKYDRKEVITMTTPKIINRTTEALGYPSHGAYARRSASAIKNIVWHYSATTNGFITKHEAFWRAHHGWDIGGYHYYIDRQGNIYQNYTHDVVTYGAGIANPYCLHICCEASSADNYMPEQIKAREELTLHLLRQLKLPASAVRGHKEMPGNWTSCPGYTKEQLNAYRADLAQKLSGSKPQAEVRAKVETAAPAAGKYQFTHNVNVRLQPTTSSKSIAMYERGETVNIERVTQAGGYYWGQYKNYGGGQSYVALGEVDGQMYTKKM